MFVAADIRMTKTLSANDLRWVFRVEEGISVAWRAVASSFVAQETMKILCYEEITSSFTWLDKTKTNLNECNDSW